MNWLTLIYGIPSVLFIFSAAVATAFAISYPFALMAKEADDRIARHFAVLRRLGL